MTKQTLFTVIISVVISAIAGFVFNHSIVGNGLIPSLGAAGNLLAENYIPYIQYNGGYNTAKSIKTTGDLTIGASGTAKANDVITTCSIISDASIAATSTGYGYCLGVTGVTSTDLILSNFATSSTNMTDQWVIAGSKASSTAGAVDFKLINLTGTARAFSANTTIGSSTVVHASH